MNAESTVELVTEDPPTGQESEEDARSCASSPEHSEDEAEWAPKGQTYPLNSKRVKVGHLQRIAGSLGLPATGTAAVTRQLIEGKLIELDREPRNAQVVVEDTSENSSIFLIDESGIICAHKPREHVTHVSQPADVGREEPSTEVRSALRDTDDELVELKRTLEAKTQELQATLASLHTAERALEDESRRCQQQNTELSEVRAALDKEKRKVKRIWREKCELQLSHEDVVDEKDVEIARLKARLLANTPPTNHTPVVSDRSDHGMDEPNGMSLPHRRGKAPPVDSFSAEGLDEHWDEWLPTFERAAEWNNWNDTERLLQLAGHLKGKTW